MFNKIISLCKKHREIITYLLFGAVTTMVGYGVYFLLYNKFDCYASLSNVISWVIAVMVAFLTNKPFVFESHDWSGKTVLREFFAFAGLRLLSGLLETGILFVLCDRLMWNGNWVKIGVGVLVIVMNYITSKCVAFRKKRQ